MDDRAKASLILRDFLRSNPLKDESGKVYNPKTNEWELSTEQGTLPTYQKQPMKKLWYMLPDFLDDTLLRYLQYNQGTGGEN